MYPNLMGQKELHDMNDTDMGDLIHVGRDTYVRKLTNGTFSMEECRTYARHFNKSVAYLFATDDTLPKFEG